MGRVLPFVACVLVTSVASATVLVPADFSEIVGGSAIIAHARIVDVRAEWADGRRWIDSVVTADVVTYLKGASERQAISFKVPGGRLGRFRSVVVGAPSFVRGEEAILFLKARGDEMPDVFGLNQGVFRIRIDSVTGQRIVVPPVMKTDPSSSEPQPLVRGAIDRKPLTFDAFGARVRETMAANARAASRKSRR
jgi:hypothetical protein